MTVAADPATLRFVPAATGELGDRVGRTANEVAEALARVHGTCVDHAPAVGPVHDELRALVARWRAAGEAVGRVADELEAADSGGAGGWTGGAWATGMLLLDRLRHDSALSGAVTNVLEGDPTSDDVDALVGWLQDHADDAMVSAAIRSGAVDLGRLLATGGVAQNAFTDWAMRGAGLGLSRTAKVGIAYTAVADTANVWDAFANHRSGPHQVSAVSQAAFDATSTACVVAPTPLTCGSAIGTGVVWGAAEAYEHREDIRITVELTRRAAAARARHLRHAVEQRLADAPEQIGRLVDVLRPPAPEHAPILPLAPGLAPLVGLAAGAGARAVDAGRAVVGRGRDLFGDRLDDAHDAVDTAYDAGSSLWRRAFG